MVLLANLQDSFATDQIATLWPNFSGSVSVTGGRARVTTDTGFNRLKSAASYTIDGSMAFVQVFCPAQGGATTDANAELMINSGTDGTDAGFTFNAVGNTLTMKDMSGFFDPSAVSITYSSTSHRWWRLQLEAGNWLWDTSPDGITWTNQRTSTAPSWATSGVTLSVALQSHRNNGTNDFAEFDNFNYIAKVPPATLVQRAAIIRASTI